MKLYTAKKETAASAAIVLDDMFLTKDLPTSAGSKMLDGYQSLFGASVIEKLEECGYAVSGKANVGEFSIDLLGESSYYGAVTDANGNLSAAVAEILKNGEAEAVLSFDVNGMPRRAAALADLCYLKPTYGIVSRFGTIAAACSGECVGVMAKTASACRGAFAAIVGHDDKDGTSLSEEKCASALASGKIQKVAVLSSFLDGVDAKTAEKIENAKTLLAKEGIAVTEIDGARLLASREAWNVLLCAELCNNVSRYDGIKYGYRTPEYKTIDELYTKSRTEAFGELLKTAILYGSDALSTDNYEKIYDKSLRIRRVMVETFAEIFAEYDAVLLPAASRSAFTATDLASDKALCFKENLYTAPASITGMPALVCGGVQFVGKAFSDGALLTLAKFFEGGEKA